CMAMPGSGAPTGTTRIITARAPGKTRKGRLAARSGSRAAAPGAPSPSSVAVPFATGTSPATGAIAWGSGSLRPGKNEGAGHAPASEFPANRLLLEQLEPALEVVGQGGGMIQSAGVQPESLRFVAPRLVDGPLQEPFPQPLADEIRRQTEL